MHVRRRAYATVAAAEASPSPRLRTITAPSARIAYCLSHFSSFFHPQPYYLFVLFLRKTCALQTFPPCPCSVSARPSHVDAAAAAELVNCKVKRLLAVLLLQLKTKRRANQMIQSMKNEDKVHKRKKNYSPR